MSDGIVLIEVDDIRYCPKFRAGEEHEAHVYRYAYDRPEHLGGKTTGYYHCQGDALPKLAVLHGKARLVRKLMAKAAHIPSCDYLHRSPPRDSDCDCGGIQARDQHLIDLAEEMADLILEAAPRY